MILRAVHTTTYTYSEPVSLCHTEVRLRPRASRRQRILEYNLVAEPRPRSLVTHRDFFGNDVATLTIDEPHKTLSITATSLVETDGAEAIHPALTPPWEQVRETVGRHRTEQAFDAFQFAMESPRVGTGPAFAEYAAPSFAAGRPVMESASELCHRIFADFKYDRAATTVSTSVEEALRKRQGVCQDFAHVMIACLRSLGLPARYVSGYLRTDDGAVGTHASHAWLALYCPGFEWLELDPTNDVAPSTGYVTLAWGRDYSDVPPVKGVALGGGDQSIGVSVRVTPELLDR